MFFAIMGAASAIAGIGLFLLGADRPVGWRTKRNLREVLERPRRVERFIYRHHRLFGGAIVAGALVLLMIIGVDHHRMVETSAWLSAPGAQLVLIAIYALDVFALIMGIYIAIRPSALKGFEALANRWIEPFPMAVSGAASPKHKFIRVLLRTPERVGMLLLLAGLCCVLAAAKMAVA